MSRSEKAQPPIPLARPSMTEAEQSAILRVLNPDDTGTVWLTGGPERARFESSLAKMAERKFALCTSSGTSALEIALWALDIGPGDSVLVTGFGFHAAANAVAARGAVPIAIDVEPTAWLMNFTLAKSAVQPHCKAIVCIDQLGVVTRGADIRALEEATGLPVIADSACGLGGFDEDGRPAGAAGRMAIFSFHPRKNITTGEGGAILCNDPELAERLAQLGNHGLTTAASGSRTFAKSGTNARLSECHCAMGSAQLARLPAMQAERNLLVAGYKQRLAALQTAGTVTWQQVPGNGVSSHQSFALLLDASCDRQQVLAGLGEQDIGCGVATYSFAEFDFHRHEWNNLPTPMAKALHHRAISLPLYIGMRSAQLDRVCEVLQSVIAQNGTGT